MRKITLKMGEFRVAQPIAHSATHLYLTGCPFMCVSFCLQKFHLPFREFYQQKILMSGKRYLNLGFGFKRYFIILWYLYEQKNK